MRRLEGIQERRSLFIELRWFVRLRWVASCAVLVGAAIDAAWLGLYRNHGVMVGVGAAITIYNLAMWMMLHVPGMYPRRRGAYVVLACAQILLDLACLTVLAAVTGGAESPVIGFFVFHMVFSSLLLPTWMAFGGAAVAVVMLTAGLWVSHQFPASAAERVFLGGRLLTLVITVAVANVITNNLRRHRRRLLRKNRHIRYIKNQLERQQQALVQQEKMVGLGQMAAGVAHEIANPLASMDGVLQLMQRKPDKVKPENVATLREQVARIHRTVQQMTAFAHPTENQWRTVGVNEVVEEALRLVRLDTRARRTVKIELELSPEAGEVRMLPHAMQQVLVNLMLNALDAMAEQPEPRLGVKTGREDGWCTIAVSDNGHGIRPEHLNRLFEPFFTTKPVGKGTGLGLSISYTLVKKQGGEIEVRSEAGKGATFIVRMRVNSEVGEEGEGNGVGVVAGAGRGNGAR